MLATLGFFCNFDAVKTVMIRPVNFNSTETLTSVTEL